MHFTESEEYAILLRSRMGGPGAILSAEALIDLKARYHEPHRHYHNWDHALSVLSWVNVVCNEFDSAEELRHLKPFGPLAPFTHRDLRTAALFHDAIYDSAGTPSNEERSAALLEETVPYPLPGVTRCDVELVLLTAQHGKVDRGDLKFAGQLFLDCDMASFGEPRWELVIENDENIERELLQRYTQDQINAGRKAFLSGLLAKRSVFLSDYFRTRFELQARDNIRRLIERIEAR